MAAARKFEYYQKNKTPNMVHVVLAHLCWHLDDYKSDPGESRDGDGNYADILESGISNYVAREHPNHVTDQESSSEDEGILEMFSL